MNAPADPADLGIQEFTDEDRAYAGSRFQEVREALFANPYVPVWGADGAAFPNYRVDYGSFLTGLLPFGQRFKFLQASKRTLDSGADLRFGPDGKGFRRLVHPNGICLFGRWEITEPTDYTGYFRQGSEALLIGRYSTCCTENRRGYTRSLSMAGKLYPTADPAHSEPLRTASFITQEDIGGDSTRYTNDAELRNAPHVSVWRRGLWTPILLLTGITFKIIDREVENRQLYQIAELGKPDGEPARTPEFMRLLVDQSQPRIEGHELDFRDEIMAQIYDKGDPQAKRELVFNIEVSDQGTKHGTAVFLRRRIKGWRRIGRLVFNEAVVSYNGDFVLHFNHPAWRGDRNDPSTAARVDGRKVG